jgi:hypothetical protein
MLPKDVAVKLTEFHVSKHKVSPVVERRGWCWAMTGFGVDAYNASEKDFLVLRVPFFEFPTYQNNHCNNCQ